MFAHLCKTKVYDEQYYFSISKQYALYTKRNVNNTGNCQKSRTHMISINSFFALLCLTICDGNYKRPVNLQKLSKNGEKCWQKREIFLKAMYAHFLAIRPTSGLFKILYVKLPKSMVFFFFDRNSPLLSPDTTEMSLSTYLDIAYLQH